MNTCFYLRFSYYFATLVILLYCVTGFILLQLPISWAWRCLGLIFHQVHFYLTWKAYIQLAHYHAILFLYYTPSKEWILVDRTGEEIPGLLQSGSICTNYFAVLYFKTASHSSIRTVWIFPDSLPPEQFRRLRKLLWWEL